MTARSACLALLAAIVTTAAAFTPLVDPSGGPLVLEERVLEAVEAWREAGLEPDDIDRTARFGYGEPGLLGPDTPVLVMTAVDPDVDVEVLVHPELLETSAGSLAYAVGLALGAPPGEDGLAAPAAGAEFAPSPSAVAAILGATAVEPADLNADGVVDFEDLLLLAEAFGEQGINLPGDLDGDGVIDERDLEILRESYTFTRPSAAAPDEPPAADDDELPPVPQPGDD